MLPTSASIPTRSSASSDSAPAKSRVFVSARLSADRERRFNPRRAVASETRNFHVVGQIGVRARRWPDTTGNWTAQRASESQGRRGSLDCGGDRALLDGRQVAGPRKSNRLQPLLYV